MTSLLRLTLSNISRRRLRSGVTMAGVAVATAVLFTLVSFQRGYQAGLKGELDKLGAHVLVVPKGCPYDAASIALHGASWPCYLKSAYLETVTKTTHVAVAAPVFMSAVYRPDTGAQTVYCGVDTSILALKPVWKIDGRAPQNSGDLLVGSETASANRWRVGDQVDCPGVEARGTVCGIIRPTQGPDDLFVYMPISDAQRLFKRPGQITHILVRLDDPANLEFVVRELRGCDAGLEMNVVPLAHLFHTIEGLVESTRMLLLCVALVGLLAAGAGVGNTLLMAVSERTREIGVLRAIGASRLQVFRMIWLETVTLCLSGGLLGVAAAILGTRMVEAWLRARLPFAPHGNMIHPEASIALAAMLAAIVVGTLSGLAPAWRAARLSPVAAIRTGGAGA